jgi:thymidine kinase
MLTLIIGPMFSGKTTRLLTFERSFLLGGRSILSIKFDQDTRYSAFNIVTHDGHKNKILPILVSQLMEIDSSLWKNKQAIIIDEGQFFPDLRIFCEQVLFCNPSIHIVIAGLSGDFQKQGFKPIQDILAFADEIIPLQSVCVKCGSPAPFSVRLTSETDQTLIGADDKYQPMCRLHSIQLQNVSN